jgi:biofilm PGA synthesis N-glycosyltransferase PgaC
MKYVLITPARNEEKYIEGTIQSVIHQTVLPEAWIIVSDGSTDGTDDIVRKYLGQYPWIQLVRMPERRDRHFAAKVGCFNAGYEKLGGVSFDVIGNLDADISFESDYIEFLLRKFAENPKLGVAGTPFVEGSESYDFRYANQDHVSGACQMFRQECFKAIGGYIPIRGGGIDWIAVTSARMKGWSTRTFTEKFCQHHRPMGTATTNRWTATFRLGKQDYYLGGHPLWQLFRAGFQIRKKPYVFGGFLLLAGYSYSALTRVNRPIPPELVKFHRSEQLQRLRQIVFGMARLNKVQSS